VNAKLVGRMNQQPSTHAPYTLVIKQKSLRTRTKKKAAPAL
jgi:hypothetical protein